MTLTRVSAFLARLMNVKYLLASIALMIALIAVLIYQPLAEFRATDPRPGIIPFQPQKQALGAESAVPVQVGMLLLNFPTFDIIKNEFIADLTIWFEFDPSLLPLETVNKFSFARSTIKEKTEADMKILGSKLFVQYGIKLAFTSPLDHTLFPLNDHQLFITLNNEFVGPDEMIFIAPRSSFLIGPNARTADWLIVGRSTQTGFFKATLDEFDEEKTIEYPAVVFSLDLAKKGIRKFFIIMLPMFILFLIASFTFLMPPGPLNRSILSLSTGTLTGLIAYRFVIERVVPDVGYFTLTDHIYNMFLVIIFVMFIVNIITVIRGEDDSIIKSAKAGTLIIAQITILLTFMYLLGGLS